MSTGNDGNPPDPPQEGAGFELRVPKPKAVYRFAFELRMLPLTGTTDVAHMRDSLDIFDFTLTHDH